MIFIFAEYPPAPGGIVIPMQEDSLEQAKEVVSMALSENGMPSKLTDKSIGDMPGVPAVTNGQKDFLIFEGEQGTQSFAELMAKYGLHPPITEPADLVIPNNPDNEFSKEVRGFRGRFMLFGEVHHDFKPKLAHKNKNFITLVRIFMLEGVGFYAHVIVSTCKSVGGYVDVVDEYYPVKINTQTREFIVIEKGEGANRQFRFRDRLRCENIDEMIEKVMMRCIEQPDAVFEPVEMNMEELDSADWWKKGEDDPEWWRRNKQTTGPIRIKREIPKDDLLPDKKKDKLPDNIKIPDTWEDLANGNQSPPSPPPPPTTPPKDDGNPFGNIVKL